MKAKCSLLFILLAMTAQAFGSQEVIYGEDDRVDVYDSDNELYVKLARSTAAMISRSAINASGDSVVISGRKLHERGICSSERFADQMTAARCSGFLVGEDLLVTAGHCVKSSSDCSYYKWVFDYKLDPNKPNMELDKGSVYGCKKIIEQKLDRIGRDDYALIQLDRKVKDRDALTFRKQGEIEEGDPLVVIGHPSGLPTKIADGSEVRSSSHAAYFVANLDTYGGNSGSAVFNSESGVVEGILVRGETDYVYDSDKKCRISNVCADDGCRGEDVSKITRISSLMNL